MKVLFLSDVWLNNILGRWATYEKQQGNEVFRACHNPDKIVCSWNFSRNGQTLLDKFGDVEIIAGGAFVDPKIRAPEYIEHLMPDYDFLGIDYALGRLTVGCPNKCPWCIVWRMWGNKVNLYDSLDNFVPEGVKKVWLLDDNLLAYDGCVELLNELADRKLKVSFQSGLDAREVTEEKAEALSRINYRSRSFKDKLLYTAFDNTKDEERIKEGIRILKKYKIQTWAYALGGFPNGDEFDDLLYRVSKLWEWGVHPYIMPYKGANRKIRDLKRCISLRYYRHEPSIEEAWKKYKR